MNELDHDKLLESIARLTEKRNRLSLEICLTQTMFDLLAVEEIALYRCEADQANLLVRVEMCIRDRSGGGRRDLADFNSLRLIAPF